MRRNRDPWTQDIPTYAPPPAAPTASLGKRLGHFVTLIGAIFAVAAAVIITQQLSRDSLALLVGLTCGVMAMLPTLALGFLVWRREDARRQVQPQSQIQQQHSQPYASPPVIVVSPQALPGYSQQQAHGQQGSTNPWMPAASPRNFTIVGGSD
jgi:hypothetical protein